MANEQYIIIPGTQQKVYEGSVVVLFRLPNLKWILHNGYYTYAGKRRNGWYFSSIPADTEMPVYNEDLVRMRVIDQPDIPCPPGPYPPGPIPPGPIPPGPYPPVPIPEPFTPQDKRQIEQAMLTFQTLAERDKFSSDELINGKVVRVNDIDGHGTIEYYSWNSATSSWDLASLGYRYMTREEINQAIGDDIVSIEWSNEHGALVITNNAGSEVPHVELLGVAHDPFYTEDDLKLTIPIYGRQNLELVIPKGSSIISIRIELQWEFPGGTVKPAIVITTTDGITEQEIAGDVSPLIGVYSGGDTETVHVAISDTTGVVTADVKLSSIVDNPLKVDNEGLWVDLTGYVKSKEIDVGMLLVADGDGGFTYAGDGIGIDTSTAISDLEYPEKFVVTANLIADAITAAITAYDLTVEERIQGLENRVSDVEDRVTVLEGSIQEIETAVEEASQAAIAAGEAAAQAEAQVEGAVEAATAAQTAAEAAEAAASAVTGDIEELRQRLDFGSGTTGQILVTNDTSIENSGYTIGTDTLSGDANTIATEQAVIDVVSWKNFG